jgi:hypothetical protein
MEHDKVSKKVYMFHTNRDILVYDLLNGSFHPWRVATDDVNSILTVFSTKASGSVGVDSDVITPLGTVLVGTDQVIISERVTAQSSETIKFAVIDDTNRVTFGSFYDTNYYDWGDVSYLCYLESGYLFEGLSRTGVVSNADPVNRKSIPNITFFFKENLDDDACKFQHKWDFSEDEGSKLWSEEIPCYQSSGSFRKVTRVQQMLRGSGAFVTFRLIGEAGKGMELYGFHVEWDIDQQNQRVK